MRNKAPYDDWIEGVRAETLRRGLDWHDARHSDFPWYQAWDEFDMTPESALDDYSTWSIQLSPVLHGI